jgi:laccase
MGKQLSMAASILCMAIVAMAAVGEAAVVEHTFVVSKDIYTGYVYILSFYLV